MLRLFSVLVVLFFVTGCGLIDSYTYTMSVLPLDAAFAINKSGAIAGRVGDNAAVYTGGTVVLLPGMAGYSALTATDIADNGFIVGTGLSAGNQRALFWSSTTAAPQDIGAIGDKMFPMSINSQGVVVGYYTRPGSSPRAFRGSTSGVTDIAPDTTSQSQAADISDTGYIAGMAVYDSIGQQVVRWLPDGTPGRFDGGQAYRALSNGSIFGIRVAPDGATLWPLTGSPIPFGPNAATHYVKQMSAAGRLVGFDQNYRAWTSRQGSNTPLYLPVPAGTLNSYANDVSACGTILGSVKLPPNVDRFVIWHKLLCDDLLVGPVFSNAS
jgi:hypothetical protein